MSRGRKEQTINRTRLEELATGDLRSIGKVNLLLPEVKTQKDFDAVFEGLYRPDRRVVMRCADAIEKLTRKSPHWLQKHKNAILALCDDRKPIELKWHLALLVPRLKLTEQELQAVWAVFERWVKDKTGSRIVRVNSLQALYDLAPLKAGRMEDFQLIIRGIRSENIPSLQARIRKLEAGAKVVSRHRAIRTEGYDHYQ